MQVCVPATPHRSVCPSIPHHNYLVSTHLFETWGRGDGGLESLDGWRTGETPMGGDSQIVALMCMGVYVCLFQ